MLESGDVISCLWSVVQGRIDAYPYSFTACATMSTLALTCSCVRLNAGSSAASNARKAVIRAWMLRHTSRSGVGLCGTSSSAPSCSSSSSSKDASASPPTLRTAVVGSEDGWACEFDNEDCGGGAGVGVSEPLVTDSAVIVDDFSVVGALGGSDASLGIMVAVAGA